MSPSPSSISWDDTFGSRSLGRPTFPRHGSRAIASVALRSLHGGSPVTDEAHDGIAAASGRAAPASPKRKRAACAPTAALLARKEPVRLDTLRPELTGRIRRDRPDLPDEAVVARAEVARYRIAYVEELMRAEHGEFSQPEREVAESIAARDTNSENVEDDFEERRSFGERVSDVLAESGGSLIFLISFAVVSRSGSR